MRLQLMLLSWNISAQCSGLTRCIPESVKTARPLFSYSGRHLGSGGTQNLKFTSPPSHKSPNQSLKLIAREKPAGWGQGLAGDIFAGCGSCPNPYIPPISINLLWCNRAVESIPAGVGSRVHHRQVTTRLSEGGPVSHFLRQIAQSNLRVINSSHFPSFPFSGGQKAGETRLPHRVRN